MSASTHASAAALAALSDYAFEHAETFVVAELDDEGTVGWANRALQRLHAVHGERIHTVIASSQWPAVDLALRRREPGWQQLMLGLAPDARGVPLDFVVSLCRLEHGWLLVAEPAEAAVSTVNERLLSLNDELASAQRRIRRQHAELERQNERLRELDHVKDALLANVSHDLRTPLTAILGYAELMNRRGGLSEKHAQAAAVIERNARRLLRLVNDLLLLAQTRAGRLQLERERLDLSDLAREAVELARPLAHQAKLSLSCETAAAGVAMVDGDQLRLAQLLDNLIANAVKFTPPGGRVSVRVSAGPEAVALSVSDTGPGIPEPEQARLYEAFVRGAQAAGPGTGLGLTIVHAVTEAHGATLAVQSDSSGTCFTVSFTPPTDS